MTTAFTLTGTTQLGMFTGAMPTVSKIPIEKVVEVGAVYPGPYGPNQLTWLTTQDDQAPGGCHASPETGSNGDDQNSVLPASHAASLAARSSKRDCRVVAPGDCGLEVPSWRGMAPWGGVS